MVRTCTKRNTATNTYRNIFGYFTAIHNKGATSSNINAAANLIVSVIDTHARNITLDSAAIHRKLSTRNHHSTTCLCTDITTNLRAIIHGDSMSSKIIG